MQSTWRRLCRIAGLYGKHLHPLSICCHRPSEDELSDVMGLVVLVLFLPALAGAMYGGEYLVPGQLFSWVGAAVYLAFALAAIEFATYWMVKLAHRG